MNSHATLDEFQLVRVDRKAKESSKRKGGGIAMFINNRWCNPGHIRVKEQYCSRDIELLAVSIRPSYLQREFSHVIAVTVYIPSSADAAATCETLHTAVSQLQTSHPQALSSSPVTLIMLPCPPLSLPSHCRLFHTAVCMWGS